MSKKDNPADIIGDNHISTSRETPLKKGAFKISNETKLLLIEEKIRDILDVLGMDIKDDSIKGTPKRVAKMFVNEIFSGIQPQKKPKISIFKNKYKYSEMLVEKNITLYSTCEHHLLPIIGKAHVAYTSSNYVIGLSKINRIVQYYANRPQVQERLTIQIVEELKNVLNTDDVACIIDAKHLCINSRGIRDFNSSTLTSEFSGKFKQPDVRKEFLNYIQLDLKY